MTRPNLFDFATSELSQDAFLCWLLSWADPSQRDEDPSLHKAAIGFLHALFDRAGHQCPEAITKVDVKQQYQNIDILAVLNDAVPLLIEDKTHTKNHSGQLARYREIVKQAYPDIADFPAIYLKTGDQSSYSEIEAAGYGVFRRTDLLEVLQTGLQQGVDDRVFLDFHAYLSAHDASVAAFSSIPVAEWHWNCWTGFFIELQAQLNDGTWDYVPNPSGGFMGFWWHWCGNKYLQLEMDKLCFKIEVEEEEEQLQQRNDWHNRLIAASASANFPISKPSRFGRGTWMTVAILNADYRKCDDNGILDIAATVEGLREAERFMDGILTSQP